jgi:hypothetical protein
MQVILLDKIAKLGGLGDQVTVKSGYARNYLLPQGKAVLASKENVATFEARRAELEAKLAEQLVAAQARADQLSALEAVVIASKSGDEGKPSPLPVLPLPRAKYACTKVFCVTPASTKWVCSCTPTLKRPLPFRSLLPKSGCSLKKPALVAGFLLPAIRLQWEKA